MRYIDALEVPPDALGPNLNGDLRDFNPGMTCENRILCMDSHDLGGSGVTARKIGAKRLARISVARSG